VAGRDADDSGGVGVDYHRFPLGPVLLRRALGGGVRRRLLDLVRLFPNFERRWARPPDLNLFLGRRGSAGGKLRRVHAEGGK